MYKHILISTDGSEIAKRGVEHGLSLAKALRAAATVITVTEPFRVYPAGGGFDYLMSDAALAEIAAGDKKVANAILSGARQSADRLGIQVETLHVPDAEPAEAIIDIANTHGCDLIVMGSHGRQGIQRLVLGSKTSAVLAHSPVPVLVTR